MLPTMLEKASFVAAALVLVAQRRVAPAMLGSVSIDALLGVLFLIAYVRTAASTAAQDAPRSTPTAAR
jgi:hypothetical protein